MEYMGRIMKRRVVGAVYTVELLITLMLFVIMWNLVISTLVMFNYQRFINTIFTSTLINMAKWGGYENNLTTLNGVGNLIETANIELQRVCPYDTFKAEIKGTPQKVTDDNEKIICILDCSFGYPVLGNKDWIMLYTQKQFKVEMDSLVLPGSLL